MPLTLILMRHAKSDWDDPLLEDIDRTLNARGRGAAPAIAKWLVGKGYHPEKVVVSAARRTVETWECMAETLPKPVSVDLSRALYLAGPDVILDVLRAQDSPTVLLICHNPGIAEFAAHVLAEPPDHPKFRQYPTAATTVIEFDEARWQDIGWGSGRVLDFVVPRDLDQAGPKI